MCRSVERLAMLGTGATKMVGRLRGVASVSQVTDFLSYLLCSSRLWVASTGAKAGAGSIEFPVRRQSGAWHAASVYLIPEAPSSFKNFLARSSSGRKPINSQMAERASKKRKRDIADVDVDLVTIYNNLASENEKARLVAAGQLLTKTFRSDTTATEDQINTALKRLFRGLCSSRKAARLGFAVALTEFLTQLQPPEYSSTRTKLVDILDSTTTPEGGSRGQEERDYYFGRIFGAEAIIKSRILFTTDDRSQWKRLLSIICAVAMKKPWLRQECGWILCQLAGDGSETLKPFVEDVVEALTAEKLVRTPEGVAIWLTAKKSYPDSKLSKHAWKHSHPLAAKDVQSLAEVMKNARSQQQDAEFGAQGSTSWTASLHFAWAIVLRQFFEPVAQPSATSKAHKRKMDAVDMVSFEQFWEIVVDESLFGTGSSTERKLWGVLLLSQVASAAPLPLLSSVLREKTLHCMIASLSGEDRYLRKSTHSALQALEKRFKSAQWSHESQASAECLKNLTTATKFIDFDSATKTKVVATLLEAGKSKQLWSTLSNMQGSLPEDDRVKRLRSLISLESKLLTSCLRYADEANVRESVATEMLTSWLQNVSTQPEDVQPYLRDRIAASLEQALKAGSAGRRVFKSALIFENLKMRISDEDINDTLQKAEKRLRKLDRMARKQVTEDNELSVHSKKPTTTSLIEGFQLLYSLVAFDIYNGEQESVEIMQDLLGIDIPALGQGTQSTDALVEILLSFSSRPSKFLRTLTPIIFESLASGLTEEGLQSLTRILSAKENTQGQREMFEGADEVMANGSESGHSDDSDELDSDVEVIDADTDMDDDAEQSESDDESLSQTDEPQDGDDELAAFDAALASALGTAADEQDGESDSDMDDEQMMELDNKLTEVFKARKEATSKKRDRKDAKENVVNFKNRVLDLLEVYIKHEHHSPHVTGLILPLLRTMRTTQTKQIAERSNKAIKDLCSRCKGQQNIPVVGAGAVDEVMAALDSVHKEACMDASNMHAAAASQVSILLVKVAVKSGVAISRIIQLYGQTLTLMMTDPKCKVQPSFFSDWNTWCTSARSWTVEQAKQSG